MMATFYSNYCSQSGFLESFGFVNPRLNSFANFVFPSLLLLPAPFLIFILLASDTFHNFFPLFFKIILLPFPLLSLRSIDYWTVIFLLLNSFLFSPNWICFTTFFLSSPSLTLIEARVSSPRAPLKNIQFIIFRINELFPFPSPCLYLNFCLTFTLPFRIRPSVWSFFLAFASMAPMARVSILPCPWFMTPMCPLFGAIFFSFSFFQISGFSY